MLTSGVELFRRVKVMEQDLFSFILKGTIYKVRKRGSVIDPGTMLQA
jgi:hypothetical protein